MKNILFIILGFVFLQCSGQENLNNKDFDLKILNEVLIPTNDRLEIDIRLINNTDTSYLLFAFKLLGEAIGDENFYIEDENITSASDVFILDSKGLQVFPADFTVSPPEDMDYKPTSLDTLQNSLARTGKAYEKGMLYLPAKSEINEELVLDFKYHDLKPGTYGLFLIYYSGKNLYNIVPEEKVREREKELTAQEFRGWIKSDTVKLIIK